MVEGGEIKWGSSCVGKKQLKAQPLRGCSVLKSPLSSPQWPWWSLQSCGKQHPPLAQKVSFFYRLYKSYLAISKTGMKYFVSVWLPLGISCVTEQHFPSQPPSLQGPISTWNHKKRQWIQKQKLGNKLPNTVGVFLHSIQFYITLDIFIEIHTTIQQHLWVNISLKCQNSPRIVQSELLPSVWIACCIILIILSGFLVRGYGIWEILLSFTRCWTRFPSFSLHPKKNKCRKYQITSCTWDHTEINTYLQFFTWIIKAN